MRESGSLLASDSAQQRGAPYRLQGKIRVVSGRYAAAQLSPQSPMMQAALGRTLVLSGKRDDSTGVLRDLHQLAERRSVSPFELALCHFALNETDQGFDWLAKAFQDRCFELISLRVDPRWHALRRTPRFDQLISQLGLP